MSKVGNRIQVSHEEVRLGPRQGEKGKITKYTLSLGVNDREELAQDIDGCKQMLVVGNGPKWPVKVNNERKSENFKFQICSCLSISFSSLDE